MPKENRKRGRRDEEKKRKRDGHDDDATHKRHKKSQDGLRDFAPQDGEQYYGGGLESEPRPEGMPELPYYGQLDEEEQEYFKRADELLELNQFEGPDERAMFLENVYQEADGKELKIANSQSCSRLMERLILLSTPAQLKKLFQAFSGQ
jgi:nucleolar protein 9